MAPRQTKYKHVRGWHVCVTEWSGVTSAGTFNRTRGDIKLNDEIVLGKMGIYNFVVCNWNENYYVFPSYSWTQHGRHLESIEEQLISCIKVFSADEL